MINLLEDMSPDDVYQWIGDGYSLVEGRPAMLLDADGEVGGYPAARMRVYDLRGEQDMWVRLSEIQCHWPVCGAVNVEVAGEVSMAVYVERRQRRQWRRTFNNQCVRLHVPYQWALERVYGVHTVRRARTVNISVVSELFNPTYPNTYEAAELIRSGERISVAISPQVSVVGDRHGTYAVYYRNDLVGGVSKGKYTPTVKGYNADAAQHQLEGIC